MVVFPHQKPAGSAHGFIPFVSINYDSYTTTSIAVTLENQIKVTSYQDLDSLCACVFVCVVVVVRLLCN